MRENIASMLRAERKARRLSLREAAKLLDTGFGHLCEIEQGKHVNLTVRTLVRAQTLYKLTDVRVMSAIRQSIAEADA